MRTQPPTPSIDKGKGLRYPHSEGSPPLPLRAAFILAVHRHVPPSSASPSSHASEHEQEEEKEKGALNTAGVKHTDKAWEEGEMGAHAASHGEERRTAHGLITALVAAANTRNRSCPPLAMSPPSPAAASLFRRLALAKLLEQPLLIRGGGRAGKLVRHVPSVLHGPVEGGRGRGAATRRQMRLR